MSTNYQRIRVTSPQDLKKLRPLIRAYVAQPSIALSVTEIALSPSEVCRPAFCLPDLDTSVPDEADTAGDAVDQAVEAYVRQLQLDEEFTEAMLSSLKQSTQPAAPRGTTRGHSSPSHSFVATAAIILLSLCKNITTLYAGASLFGSMGTPRGRGNVTRSLLQEYLLKSNYGFLAQPALQKLERVEIVSSTTFSEDERMYIDIEIIDVFQFFHRLPTIRSVVMEGVQHYQSAQHLFVPRTGNMRKLHIGPVDVPSSMLGTIISIPKELEELTVVVGGLWSTDGGQPLIYTKTIRKALLLHKKTLRVLDVDMEVTIRPECPPGNSEDEGEGEVYSDDLWTKDNGQAKRYGEEHLRIDRADSAVPSPQTQQEAKEQDDESTLSTICEFNTLTHLSIGIQLLLQLACPGTSRLIDGLPPNLEFLCIYGYEKGGSSSVDSQIEELMISKAEKLPKLKEIQGVEEVVPDMKMKYGRDPDEDYLWERPEKYLGWNKA